MSLVYSVTLAILATLGHGYFWTDAVNRLHAWPGSRKIVDGLTLFCLLAFLSLPVLALAVWFQNEPLSEAAVPLTYTFTKWYFYFCVAWGVLSLLMNTSYRLATDNRQTLLDWKHESRNTEGQIGTELLSAGLPQLLGKVPFNQVFQLTVDRKRLAIPELPLSHEGIKVAHISDLHMTGRIGPEWYAYVAEEVNRLEADLILLTGDIVEKRDCWPWLADSVGRLRAKHGVYFILGNHDLYIDEQQTRQLLQDQGLTCLSENWVEVEYNGAPILLAGNERPWAPRATDLSSAPVKEAQSSQFRLMLLHTPDIFSWAVDQQADLALAGHTHGGQIRFPLLGPIACPSRYGTRYASGVFRRGNSVLHVTRGVSGKTPLRWRCPPEIALLELVKA